jgi:hypothetical protein
MGNSGKGNGSGFTNYELGIMNYDPDTYLE